MQQHTSYGPGDPVTWGPITSPYDPRCDSDDDLREWAVQIYCRRAMSSPRDVGEARGCFTDTEDAQIDAAVAAGDAELVGALTIAAVDRVIRDQAQRISRQQIERLVREAEDDAVRDRAGI